MTTAQHTPGPWTYDKGDDYVRENATGYCLARVFEDSEHPDPKYTEQLPQEANARLIAAAPELLEALKRAVTETIDAFKDDPIGQEYTSGWLSEACAAIAKAMGQ